MLMMKSKYSFFLSVLSWSTIAVSSNLIFTAIAEARPCGHTVLDRIGCTIDPFNSDDNGSVFATKFTVYVKNNAQTRIRVTAKYMNNFEAGKKNGCATFQGRTEDCPDTVEWKTESWIVNPDEEAFIIDNAVGRNIYLSAKSLDGELVWKSEEVDMGPDYRRFNYSFVR
jgi:hypothetical protein